MASRPSASRSNFEKGSEKDENVAFNKFVTPEHRSGVKKLLSIFPQHSSQYLNRQLIKNSSSVSQATQYILSLKSPSSKGSCLAKGESTGVSSRKAPPELLDSPAITPIHNKPHHRHLLHPRSAIMVQDQEMPKLSRANKKLSSALPFASRPSITSATIFPKVNGENLEMIARRMLQYFPSANLEDCRRELELENRDPDQAFENLKDLYSHDLDVAGESQAMPILEKEGNGMYESQNAGPAPASKNASGGKRKYDMSKEGDNQNGTPKAVRLSENYEHKHAGEWIIQTYGNLSADTLVSTVRLECGVHPYQFPKTVLADLSTHHRISQCDEDTWYTDTDRETFDMAVQYHVCEKVILATSGSGAITSLIKLARYSEQVASHARDLIKNILLEDRDALKNLHIRSAYGLASGHCIRDLLVHVVFRPYVEYRESAQFVNEEDVEDSFTDDEETPSSLNLAQRSAYCSTNFRFKKELKWVTAFRRDLLEEFHQAWWRREHIPQIGRSKFAHDIIRLCDPFTGEMFEIS